MPNLSSSRFPLRSLAAGLVAAALLTAAPALAGMIAAGDAMPPWSMKDQDGKLVNSSELAGKTYLLWYYPKAQTPGCTAEARSLRDNFAPFEAAGVTLVGVSFDSPDSNKAFVDAESLPFRLLSDEDHKLAIAVGAASYSFSFFPSRISYLVGPDGKVLKAYDDVDPAVHAAQVLADAQALKAAGAGAAPAAK